MRNKSNGPVYISVVSGKGGTGKSLFTAVLGNCLAKENLKVLLVDMDLHVRGLTILLSSYMDKNDNKIAISDYSLQKKESEFAVYRFQECEFIPAVKEISEPLAFPLDGNYMDEYSADYYSGFFEKLKDFTSNKMYDIVLLDCRSGLDSSIIQCVKNSDYTLSVSEDDDICLNANLNLVNYFRHNAHINSVYTIINKGRRINTPEDIEKKVENIFDFSCLGVIPFDEQIMEDYGKDRFWLSVYNTLYFYGLVMVWDKFQEKTKLQCGIDKKKYNIKDSKNTAKTRIRFKLYNVIKLYGYLLLFLCSISPLIMNLIEIELTDSFLYVFLFLAILGMSLIIVSSTDFRRFLFSKYDDPEKFNKK
ncbi:MAG: AAA family ATPase [Clostridia bacterium]|nr:AAA family ATPase [Clostridia bacterium]